MSPTAPFPWSVRSERELVVHILLFRIRRCWSPGAKRTTGLSMSPVWYRFPASPQTPYRPSYLPFARTRRCLSVGFITLCIVTPTLSPRADSPRQALANTLVHSPDGHCFARIDLKASRLTGGPVAAHTPMAIWQIEGSYPLVAIANDCESLVALYDGGNLLEPVDVAAGTVVMRLFVSGRLVRCIRLGELYSDPGALPRTASHALWYRDMGWQGRVWRVTTVDGRMITFDSRARATCHE